MIEAGELPPLLSASGISVSFRRSHKMIQALRGVSLSVTRGEVLAIVGESGSGKSTLARAIMGMIPFNGLVALEGETLPKRTRERSQAQRRRVSMVFQDNASGFDPRFTVERILLEPLRFMDTVSEVTPTQLLDSVGLSAEFLRRRPHELSGGQRQRVGIARALAGNPDLLICDEAVSALDVSVQAQILNLLAGLQVKRQLAFIFITHDLGVVQYFADRVAVMRDGDIVEYGALAEVLDHPRHPYTKQLLDSMPRVLGPETR